MITRRRLRAQNTRKGQRTNAQTERKDLAGEAEEKYVREQQTDGWRTIEKHTNTHKHTHNRINMKMVPMGQSSPVYLPYSLRVLQRAGRARPRLKDDTHGPALPSTATHITSANTHI